MTSSRTVVRFVLSALVIGLVSLATWQVGGALGARSVTPARGEEPPLTSPDVVTIDDVNDAVGGTLACLESKDIETFVHEGAGLRPTRYTFAAGTNVDTLRQAKEQESECAAGLREVQKQWSNQQTQPSAEEFQALVARMTECVETGAQGTTLSNPVAIAWGPYNADPSYVMRINEDQLYAFVNCALAEEAETGLSPLPYEVVQ